jgi:hypothetical protein
MESIGVLRWVDGAPRCVYDEVARARVHEQEGPGTYFDHPRCRDGWPCHRRGKHCILIVIAGNHVYGDREARKRFSRLPVLRSTTVVGNVAGHDNQIEVILFADVAEHGVECVVRVVSSCAFGFCPVLQEMRVGQLQDPDRVVHEGLPRLKTVWHIARRKGDS